MDNVILQGFSLFWHYAWLVPGGVMLGMIVGATPGLTSANSLAILLPFLISIPPECGLILGISIYSGAEMGNSFPAIMFNIPGTASSAVTALEGYPLMKKGEAARAVGICVFASFLGSAIGGMASSFLASA